MNFSERIPFDPEKRRQEEKSHWEHWKRKEDKKEKIIADKAALKIEVAVILKHHAVLVFFNISYFIGLVTGTRGKGCCGRRIFSRE